MSAFFLKYIKKLSTVSGYISKQEKLASLLFPTLKSRNVYDLNRWLLTYCRSCFLKHALAGLMAAFSSVRTKYYKQIFINIQVRWNWNVLVARAAINNSLASSLFSSGPLSILSHSRLLNLHVVGHGLLLLQTVRLPRICCIRVRESSHCYKPVVARIISR